MDMIEKISPPVECLVRRSRVRKRHRLRNLPLWKQTREDVGIPALQEWACRPNQSIWLEILHRNRRTGRIWGMSERFQNAMKPIFLYVYRQLRLHRCPKDLLMRLESDGNDGLIVRDGDWTQDSDPTDLHDVIESLQALITYVVNADPPFGNLTHTPLVINKFHDLCDRALESNDRLRIRALCYFILRNPILFDDRDGISFLQKGYNLSMMNYNALRASVPMADLQGYINLIDPSHGPLFACKVFEYTPREYNAPGFVPMEYYMGCSCFKYFENFKRHVQEANRAQRFNTLTDIFVMLTSVLPDVLPTAYYDLATTLTVHNIWFRIVGNRYARYIDFMHQAPELVWPE